MDESVTYRRLPFCMDNATVGAAWHMLCYSDLFSKAFSFFLPLFVISLCMCVRMGTLGDRSGIYLEQEWIDEFLCQFQSKGKKPAWWCFSISEHSFVSRAVRISDLLPWCLSLRDLHFPLLIRQPKIAHSQILANILSLLTLQDGINHLFGGGFQD